MEDVAKTICRPDCTLRRSTGVLQEKLVDTVFRCKNLSFELRVPGACQQDHLDTVYPRKNKLAVISDSQDHTFLTAAILVHRALATTRGSTHTQTHEGGLSFSATIQDSIRQSSVRPDGCRATGGSQCIATATQVTAQPRTAGSSCSQRSLSPHSELTHKVNFSRSSNEHRHLDELPLSASQVLRKVNMI